MISCNYYFRLCECRKDYIQTETVLKLERKRERKKKRVEVWILKCRQGQQDGGKPIFFLYEQIIEFII